MPRRNCVLQGGKLGCHSTDLLAFHWPYDLLLQTQAVGGCYSGLLVLSALFPLDLSLATDLSPVEQTPPQ